MIYNILSIRKADDPDDTYCPPLDGHLMPRLRDSDSNVRFHSLDGLSVSRVVGSGSKRVIGARGIKSDLWVTDSRLIVRCKNYDKVRWTGDNTIDQMIWGAGWATTDFLVSKAYHRIKSLGKAMVGHIYMPWISAVAYQPSIRRVQPGSVRVMVNSQQTNGNTKSLLLTMNLHNSEDSRAVAEDLYQRVCAWWLGKPDGVTDAMLARVQERSGARFVVPEPGSMSYLRLPYFRFTHQIAGLTDVNGPHTSSPPSATASEVSSPGAAPRYRG